MLLFFFSVHRSCSGCLHPYLFFFVYDSISKTPQHVMLCYVMLCTAVMAMALSVDATDLYACKFFFHFVVVPLLFFRSFSCLLAFRLSTSRLQIFSWEWASFPRIFFNYSQRFSYNFFFNSSLRLFF